MNTMKYFIGCIMCATDTNINNDTWRKRQNFPRTKNNENDDRYEYDQYINTDRQATVCLSTAFDQLILSYDVSI